MSYILYIDESGDEGIDLSNKRQSPYFFLSAFLLREDRHYQNLVTNKIQDCEKEIGKEIHFTNLSHEKKKHVCLKLQNLPIKFFGLVSDKKGLEVTGYGQKIIIEQNLDGKKGRYYNKNVKYLLESVQKFCNKNNIRISRIIFDKIDSKNYEQLRRYLQTISNVPFHDNAKSLKDINPNIIIAKSTKEEPLLKIADVLANSLHRAFIARKLGGIEDSYLSLLRNNFANNGKGEIIDYSLIFKPRGLNFLNLSQDRLIYFKEFKNVTLNETLANITA